MCVCVVYARKNEENVVCVCLSSLLSSWLLRLLLFGKYGTVRVLRPRGWLPPFDVLLFLYVMRHPIPATGLVRSTAVVHWRNTVCSCFPSLSMGASRQTTEGVFPSMMLYKEVPHVGARGVSACVPLCLSNDPRRPPHTFPRTSPTNLHDPAL